MNAYETIYSRPCQLPYLVDQALTDYSYEKSVGKKSRRWFEAQVERIVLESLTGEKAGQIFSHDFLEDENIVDLLRQGWESGGEEEKANCDNGDHGIKDDIHGVSGLRHSSSSGNVRRTLLDILNKMESKGLIYFLPFGSHKAHHCVIVDRRCQLTKMILVKLKQLAKGAGVGKSGGGLERNGRRGGESGIDSVSAGRSGSVIGSNRTESGFSAKEILSHVRSANEEFCLVKKVAVERCLEILENESEVYSVGKFRFMPV